MEFGIQKQGLAKIQNSEAEDSRILPIPPLEKTAENIGNFCIAAQEMFLDLDELNFAVRARVVCF